MQEIVEAFDVDEALTVASERRPELFRPQVAFLVGGQLDDDQKHAGSTLATHE